MIVPALWIIAGFFTILVYPHTSGKTDIEDGEDLVAIVLFWPFALFIAFKVRDYAKFSAHGVTR